MQTGGRGEHAAQQRRGHAVNDPPLPHAHIPKRPPPQALAEKEGEGIAKMLYRKDTGEILGVHIFGLHAADLIHEASNAIAPGQTVQVRARVCVCVGGGDWDQGTRRKGV